MSGTSSNSSDDIRSRLRVLRPHRTTKMHGTPPTAQDIRDKLRRLRPNRHCPYAQRQVPSKPDLDSPTIWENRHMDAVEEHNRRAAICEWARSLPPEDQLNILLYSQAGTVRRTSRIVPRVVGWRRSFLRTYNDLCVEKR